MYSVLYVLIQGEVFKFKAKMNGSNNWFDYREGCSKTRDDNGHRNVITKFGLEKKKFGSNEFWACTLQNIGVNDVDVSEKVKEAEATIYNPFVENNSSTEVAKEPVDEIKIENIPF